MDYAAITQNGDRSCTPVLLARLRAPDLSDDEPRRLTLALSAASDPRALAPLTEILVDASVRPELRRAVGRSLGDWLYDGIPDGQWLAWWRAGDPVLREVAFGHLGLVGREDVLTVERDRRQTAEFAEAVFGAVMDHLADEGIDLSVTVEIPKPHVTTNPKIV